MLKSTHHAILLIAITLSMLSMPVRVSAQVAGGTISGVVTDGSGAVVPRAQVVIENMATRVGRTVSTNENGLFGTPNLAPGEYSITVAAPGFANVIRSGVTLAVGGEVTLNIELRLGSATEKVEIRGDAPAVDLATSSLSAYVDGNTVRELPLNGRSWTDLATLQPGVSAVQTQLAATSASRGNRGFGAQLAVSGARPQQNNYRLDGISINDYANGGPGSVLGGNLGVDAVQEFSVLTSNYSAEYGKTSGGVINAITRSGTNSFHGSAYEFLRNSALDARNFFDKAIPPFKRNQFGATAGGPILKNRTFIFGDYEAIRQSLGTTNNINVPSPDARNGRLSTGNVAVDPIVQKYLSLYPLPNNGLLGKGDTGVFSFAGQQVTNEDFFTIKVDHRLSDKDSLRGVVMFDNAPFTTPDSFNNVLLGSRTRRVVAAIEETRVLTPSFINSFRFGVNRSVAFNTQGVAAINPAASDSSLGAVPGRNAAIVTVPGLTRMLGGLGASATYIYHFTSFQLYNDAFYNHGLHSLKFGFALERMRNNINAFNSPSGLFTFNSLPDFLVNRPLQFQAGFPGSLTARGLRQAILGGYIQDDWKLRPNLTVNFGLRYEMSTVPSEVQGKLSALRQIGDAQPHLGDPYFSNPTLRNFEPRVGLAWDPFGDGKTAIRAGFGMFDVLPMLYQFELVSALTAPYFQLGSVTNLPAGSFPSRAFSLITPATLAQAYIEPNPKRNYVMQWNLNVQRTIVKDVTATVGYVGSRGIHQPFRTDDINIVLPQLTPNGYLWPSPAGSGIKVNPNAGQIRGLMWKGNSWYDALEMKVAKRFSRGFQIQGSYTWGKSIDNNSATIAGDAFANSVSSLHWFDPKLSRGLSDYNVGRSAAINGIWEIPGGHAPPAISWALNGWQLGGVYKVSDGLPFTAQIAGDPLGLKSADPYDFPNRLTGPDCSSLVNAGNPNNYIKTQCFAFPNPATLRGNAGRNILTGPGLSNLDFSLFKNNRVPRISETFNAQFRVEIFNVLNRANFEPPTNNLKLFDGKGARVASAGLLDSTATTAREIQFALKLMW